MDRHGIRLIARSHKALRAGAELFMGWVGLGHTKWTHGQLCAGGLPVCWYMLFRLYRILGK